MKIFRKISAFLLIFSFLLLSACSFGENKEDEDSLFPYIVSEGIVVEKAYSYSGAFPEDGSFTEKENVLALKVTNQSEVHVRLLKIYVTTNEKEMVFEITTLPAGMSVNVFEKNAQGLSENEEIVEIKSANRVDFEDEIGIHRGTFELYVNDKTINIKNVSNADIESDIYLYYKKKDKDGSYFGGITFRTKAGGLKSDELKQLPAAHFSFSDSEIVFIDYIDK
ncbi:MAG: hypothetical protein J6A67_02515 [Clostridia bacterium]|nr:hypothetical protein [Clostridia bacterium]